MRDLLQPDHVPLGAPPPVSLPSCYAPCLRLLFTQGAGMLRPMKPAGLG